MICPKCGTEIKEGYLYCQKCGEEIMMVPDYEVELEAGIEETISEVAGIIADSVGEGEESRLETDNPSVPDIMGNTMPYDIHGVADPMYDGGYGVSDGSEDVGDNSAPKNDESTLRRLLNRVNAWFEIRSLGPVLFVAVALCFILFIVFGTFKIVNTIKSYYSYDEQYAEAEEEFLRQDYEAVVKTARHVISIKPDDEKAKLLLADSYFALKKYDESIAVLNELLKDFPQDTGIYERLLHNYEMQGDIDSIIKLSQESHSTAVSKLFSEYVCDEPEFSIDSGSYFEPQAVRLMCNGTGKIYYTLNGKKPNENSEVYTTPIRIDEGETTISAVHINDKGVASDIVSKTYTITIIPQEVPRIITQGGDYKEPSLIKAAEPKAGTIYYTNDGTDPTLSNAREYVPPLPMPLGKSEYRFAIINDSGVSSEIVTVKYNLTIRGNVDKDTAQAAVQLRLLALGHMVMDNEFLAKYGYYANGRSYYIIEEYAPTDGKKIRQNTLYAVDSETGEIFTITRNEKKGDYDFGIVL
ncbi:MAG: chitobiase/beta-hexosaminidase C-terminal domain-containing protein [Lachnospiraceae bacterium]|nr:chitobiase/beta-hexosaminidase C-terminal domain-containing protein [Lachnospiraceae bacterium]